MGGGQRPGEGRSAIASCWTSQALEDRRVESGDKRDRRALTRQGLKGQHALRRTISCRAGLISGKTRQH